MSDGMIVNSNTESCGYSRFSDIREIDTISVTPTLMICIRYPSARV